MNDGRAAPRPLLEIRLEPLLWAAAVLLFLGLRFAVTWQAPVGAEELPALSGAWQAAHGNDNGRFLPTLFQAVAALLLLVRDTEVLPRLVAFLLTATIPAALWTLRPVLGPAAALAAVIVLALDAPGIYLGVAATTSGFDLAIATWLFAVLARPDLRAMVPPAGLVVIGFVVATSGPIVLPLLLAAAVIFAKDLRGRPDTRQLAIAGGALAGIVAASLHFGFGGAGVVVAPLAGFGAAFEPGTSSVRGFDQVLLYSWPVLAGGLAGAALLLWRRRELDPSHWLLLAWAAAGGAWLVAAIAHESTVAVAAATLPCALLAACAIVAALPAIRDADWTVARFALPAGIGMAVIGLAYSVDWARTGSVGDDVDLARVIALYSAAVAALAVAAVEPQSRPTLLVPALALGVLVAVPGAFGVGLSAISEPLPSPTSTASGRVLRALALETREEVGGEIVVHPQFRDEVLWPFRDSGEIVIASRVSPEAALVLWPADLPQPEGFAVLEGQWSLLDDVQTPTGGFLQLLRWYTDRNRLSVSHSPLAVYIRSE